MKKRYNKNFFNPIYMIALFLVALVIMLTVGFSLFSESLRFSDLGVNVEIQSDIRVTGVSIDSTADNGVSNWEEYRLRSILSGISLPYEDSSVTYAVEITNVGNAYMGISSIRGLQDNLEYTISNYTMKDTLCDDSDSTQCSLGSVSTLYITIGYADNGYDENNIDYSIRLNYIFKQVHDITYEGINDENYPKTVLHGEDVHVNLDSPYPNSLIVSGSNSYSYNSDSGLLSIINVTNDITVTTSFNSYFVEYDGSVEYDNNGSVYYKTFGEFNNTNITEFKRDTSSSLSDVLSKVNNGDAKIISTSANDPNYPSVNPIYGWVSNNILYWWSESEIAYFHPNTKSAFRNMGKVVKVDFTDIDTSKVKNFSHWFDKDRVLTTIKGKINTNGLVLEYAENYNYGIDNDENGSSGKGLTYMFNDCNALTGIDLSEFNTTNASDMKRMFGGCSNITSLDLSGFDTRNARSMYWMFRKMTKMKEIDLSYFNTTNVENMRGMFLSCSALVTVKFGDNFDTRNLKVTRYMFSGASNLTTIFAKRDFDTSSLTDSAQMFNNTKKLVGASGTDFAVTFNSSYNDASYAKIATPNTRGYFTLDENQTKYYITYKLNGGEATNPSIFFENTSTFTLVNPVKKGYDFIGWTGSNGNVPQMTVTVNTGTTENLTFIANYQAVPASEFPKVFSISGSCNFNGSSANITGNTCVSDLDDNTVYTNGSYIDTNIKLYSSTNYTKDFEIYLEMSNYNPDNQEIGSNGDKQNTILNTKAENISGYPGIVFRKSNANLEAKSFTSAVFRPYADVTSIKILRINRIIYYSFNGESLTQLDDNSNYNNTFDLSVWLGASKNSSGQPFRYFTGTLSNIYIKLGKYSLQ